MKSIHPMLSYIINTRFFMDRESFQSLVATLLADPESFYFDEAPTYEDNSTSMADKLTSVMAGVDPNITLTRNFSETDIPFNSIAYHRMFGPVIADEEYYRWYFSTKQFIKDVKAAESNPNIISHFCHVSTGGGEAWMLEKAYEVVKATLKPFIFFIEKKDCSAGYYISSAGNKIYCYTINDTIGSIGCMVAFWDIVPYFVKEGFSWIEEYAHKSDLKNKKFNDLTDGKAEQYITEELDPLQEQFESAVRAARPALAKLEKDHPAFRGETFDSLRAQQIGLIDEIAEIEQAILYTHQQGMEYLNKKSAQKRALNYLQ